MFNILKILKIKTFETPVDHVFRRIVDMNVSSQELRIIINAKTKCGVNLFSSQLIWQTFVIFLYTYNIRGWFETFPLPVYPPLLGQF